ncbi:MFS transporter [Christensenellaceae bacterium OttesenSCG-928-K19]|nr:MFS transporter [Christensenellaceae bacterium OttesenSCG-928-K19]
MRRNIFLMNLAAAFLWMGMYSYAPVLPAYAASIGANIVMIGIIGGSYGIMQIILRIPLGIVADKLNKDHLILIVGFAVLTLSTVLFIFAEGVYMLIFARAVAGAAAAWWVVVCVSFSKYYPENEQVKAQGKVSASANMGKVIAAVLCAVVAQFISYQATFILAFVIAAVGLVMMFGLKDQKAQQEKPASVKEQLALLKNRELLSFSILALLSQMLCFAIPTTFAAVAAEELGADGLQLGLLTAVYFLFTSLFSLFVGTKLYKKMGGQHVLAISFLIGAFSCMPVFYHSSLVQIFIMQALSGISYGITIAALGGFAIRSVPVHQRGAATGIFQSIFGVGIFLGPVVTGFTIDGVSSDAAYWLMFILMLVAAALCYVLVPKRYHGMT